MLEIWPPMGKIGKENVMGRRQTPYLRRWNGLLCNGLLCNPCPFKGLTKHTRTKRVVSATWTLALHAGSFQVSCFCLAACQRHHLHVPARSGLDYRAACSISVDMVFGASPWHFPCHLDTATSAQIFRVVTFTTLHTFPFSFYGNKQNVFLTFYWLWTYFCPYSPWLIHLSMIEIQSAVWLCCFQLSSITFMWSDSCTGLALVTLPCFSPQCLT